MHKRLLPSLFLLICSFVANAQYFIENKGQWPESVLYAADIEGGKIFIENDGFVFNLTRTTSNINSRKTNDNEHAHDIDPSADIKGHAFKLKIANAHLKNNNAEVDKTAGKYNYFKGHHKNWAKNCLAYSVLEFKNIIDGVDIQLFRDNGQIKWNFICKSKSKAEKIQWQYIGIDANIDRKDVLSLKSNLGKLEENLPLSYIENGNEIEVNYLEIEKNIFGFDLSNVNSALALTIDPVLAFSTYSGSTSDNFGYTATFDSEGFLYSGSSAFGTGYPTTLGAYDETYNNTVNRTDIAISKFDTSGKFLVYSTFLGGNNDDLPHSILANPNGELYVLGSTSSPDFPVTPNAEQSTFIGGPPTIVNGLGINYSNGADIIVSLLSSDGSNLLSSTFLGGSDNDGFISNKTQNANPCIYNYADEVRGEIEFDRNGDIVIATSTYSNDFPFIGGVYQTAASGNTDGLVIKMKPNLDVMWATYLGGEGYEGLYSIQATKNNDYVVAGGSNSDFLPFTQNGFQATRSVGRNDGFIATLSPDGTSVKNGTHFGYLAYDQIYFVDLNTDGEILVFGQTEDEFNSFIQGGTGYADQNSGLFVSKFDSSLSTLIWSTTIGSGSNAPNLSPTAFLTDVCNRIFISGWGGATAGSSSYNQTKLGRTTGLSTTNDAFQSTTDGSDIYFAIFDADFNAQEYATFFGGPVAQEHVDGGTSRFDKNGIIYQAVCAGCRGNSDFPIQPSDAHSPNNRSTNCNLGVFKFDPELNTLSADFASNGPYCGNDMVIFNNLSENFVNVSWDFGDGQTSTDRDPNHVYSVPGEYKVTLIVSDPLACNIADTISQKITILPDDIVANLDTTVCLGETLNLDFSKNLEFNANFNFTPSQGNPDEQFGKYSIIPTDSTQILLDFKLGSCERTVEINVATISIEPLLVSDSILCNFGEKIDFNVLNGGGLGTSFIWSNNSNFTPILNSNTADSNFSRTINQAEKLFVKVETEFCSFIDSINFEILSTSFILEDEITVCDDNTPVRLFPLLSETGQNSNLNFEWRLDSNILSTQQQIFATVFDTTYYLTVSNGSCTFTDSIFVNIADVVQDSLAIRILSADSASGNYTLGVFTSDSSRMVIWSPSNLFSNPNNYTQNLQVFDNTSIFLQSFEKGCSNRDSIFLKAATIVCGPPNIFIPSGFSPNGDGNNDVVEVRGDFIESMQLEIFDQWGQKVFESNNQNDTWDGTFKNQLLNPAVFVYQFSALCISNQVYTEKGNITLIR